MSEPGVNGSGTRDDPLILACVPDAGNASRDAHRPIYIYEKPPKPMIVGTTFEWRCGDQPIKRATVIEGKNGVALGAIEAVEWNRLEEQRQEEIKVELEQEAAKERPQIALDEASRKEELARHQAFRAAKNTS